MRLLALQAVRVRVMVRLTSRFRTRQPIALYSTSWEQMAQIPPIQFIIVEVLFVSRVPVTERLTSLLIFRNL